MTGATVVAVNLDSGLQTPLSVFGSPGTSWGITKRWIYHSGATTYA